MVIHHSVRLPAILFLLLALGAPARAQGIEYGQSTVTPWSGWWWPARIGSLVLGYRSSEPGPLAKQDQVTGKHAAAWEESQPFHFDLTGEDWWGHCHAWAAASVQEPEPRHDVVMGSTVFHVGDIKGLLTEAHYSDQATFYGQRYNGNPGDDFQDMHPFLLWSVLRKYLHDNQTPLILDLSPGPQVWSYPVYRYSLAYWPVGNGAYQGELAIWAGNFLVTPDTVGTATQERIYTFAFQAQGNQLTAGTDQWTGDSVQDHPDFAWYPTARAQQNPELDYTLVTQLAQKGSGQ
jgi:Transglutaminase elicitor